VHLCEGSAGLRQVRQSDGDAPDLALMLEPGGLEDERCSQPGPDTVDVLGDQHAAAAGELDSGAAQEALRRRVSRADGRGVDRLHRQLTSRLPQRGDRRHCADGGLDAGVGGDPVLPHRLDSRSLRHHRVHQQRLAGRARGARHPLYQPDLAVRQ